MVAAKASCTIFSRSAGRPGGAMYGPADALPGVEEFDRLLVFGLLREIDHERHVLQLRIRL